MKLGRIRPAPRKPAPKKLAPVKPAPKKPTPVKPTPVKPPTNIYSKRPGMPEIGFPAIPSPGAPRMISPGPTPSPGLPTAPDRGNVETNYRGIPGLVNATAPVPRARPDTGMPPPDMSRTLLPGPPSGGAPTMGGTFANQLLGRSAPSGGATGNPTGVKLPPGGLARPVFQGMKKGGEVKASKAPKASSASKRGDGIAIKGKTKGRFV